MKLLRSLGVNTTGRARAPGRERMVANFAMGFSQGTFILARFRSEVRKTGLGLIVEGKLG